MGDAYVTTPSYYVDVPVHTTEAELCFGIRYALLRHLPFSPVPLPRSCSLRGKSLDVAALNMDEAREWLEGRTRNTLRGVMVPAMGDIFVCGDNTSKFHWQSVVRKEIVNACKHHRPVLFPFMYGGSPLTWYSNYSIREKLCLRPSHDLKVYLKFLHLIEQQLIEAILSGGHDV